MELLLISGVLLPLSGLLAWLFGPLLPGARVGLWGCVAGCLIGLVPATQILLGSPPVSIREPWAVPGASFHIGLDALSALFLVPILIIAPLSALYGSVYLAGRPQHNLGSHAFFFNLLTASMGLVVIARDGLLFLIAWEVMALASFFLVTTDDEHEQVRRAGWGYLVATHLGTALLLGFFALLGREAGSLDFDSFGCMTSLTPGVAGLLFLLALAGFGAKAGFVPFHVWLPEAHPAAPSHVSALMSGVMIKTGIYGLVRALTFLGTPAAWWGWLLIGAGLACGIVGALFALAQHDLKRLLAYCSVENIGIVTLGLGIGVMGLAANAPAVAAIGFAGGLLHVINHSVFKSLLFLCAGSVLHATGTGTMDRLGGLLKRMPQTGLPFLAGAGAAVGLPLLNGFTSEFLVFLAAFMGVSTTTAQLAVPLLAAIAGLALISGLAVACFAKAIGVGFLGEPRTHDAEQAHDPALLMRLPQLALALLCAVIGLGAPFMLRAVGPAVNAAIGRPAAPLMIQEVTPVLWRIVGVCVLLWVLAALLVVFRRYLLKGQAVRTAVTWDCGYLEPSARMQYTGSSLVQPLMVLFGAVLQTRYHMTALRGLFPEAGAFSTTTPDPCVDRGYRPLFLGIVRSLGCLRRLQHGNLQLYVLYIAVTLLGLLIWKLGVP